VNGIDEPILEAGTDPGAEFVPGAGPDDVERVLEPVRINVKDVQAALQKGTGIANDFAGESIGANLRMSDLESSLIAPGIVRYLESRPQLAAAAIAGGNEYLQLVIGSGVYGIRVARERTATLEQRETEKADESAAPALELGGSV
jgi:hypothetical protein